MNFQPYALTPSLLLLPPGTVVGVACLLVRLHHRQSGLWKHIAVTQIESRQVSRLARGK